MRSVVQQDRNGESPVPGHDENAASPVGEHDSLRLADVSEAAAALGLTPNGIRARIRRGTLPARKGNDGQWRVTLSTSILSRQDDRQNRRDASAADRQDNPLQRLAWLEERLRADDKLRAALAVEQVARARAEGERDVARAEGAVLREALAREADHARQERVRADRLEAALVEARRPWLARLLEAVRRR
jgi:hypothetical protein